MIAAHSNRDTTRDNSVRTAVRKQNTHNIYFQLLWKARPSLISKCEWTVYTEWMNDRWKQQKRRPGDAEKDNKSWKCARLHIQWFGIHPASQICARTLSEEERERRNKKWILPCIELANTPIHNIKIPNILYDTENWPMNVYGTHMQNTTVYD